MSDVRNFGAVGDGQADDTQAIQHAVNDGDGRVQFSRGSYRITKTIEISLDKLGFVGIDGSGGTAKIIHAGAGPAFRITGTHGGTGAPSSVKPNIWLKQRLPTVQNIEIEGAHAEADGVELVGTMQSVFEGVLIRQVRHGIRLHQRNRNVLISHCHIYHNTGVGIFLDEVNLHQINIASNHISYNRLGGIRIEGSEVRNLQITGNDIEYNNHRSHETDPEPTAEIYVDTSTDGASVGEFAIASNTIQATPSPQGANILVRDQGGTGIRPQLWTITGNIIGNQENNVHLIGCSGVILSGNYIYSCEHRNLLVEDSRQITVGTCGFRRHTPSLGMGVRVVNSTDCIFNGCTLHDEAETGQASGAPLMELVDCDRVNITGCQFIDGVPTGLELSGCDHVNVTGCTFMETRETKHSKSAIRVGGESWGNLITANIIGPMKEHWLALDARAEVEVEGNVVKQRESPSRRR